MPGKPSNKQRIANGTFAPGNTGGPGRPKGALGRRTLVLQERLRDAGAEPEMFLLAVMNGDIKKLKRMTVHPGVAKLIEPEEVVNKDGEVTGYLGLTLDKQIRAAEFLMGYLYPKLRVKEIDMGQGHLGPINITMMPAEDPIKNITPAAKRRKRVKS